MRFNNFTIESGESKNAIIDKINSNFSQIISFSSGPKGRIGEVGPTGYSGSAGPTGEIGPTGQRATEFEISPQQPLAANDYDYWIDLSPTGEFGVYRYSSAWTDTGVSFLEPGYFSVKTSIPTFTLPTEYSAIYFDGTDQANKFLTISDSGHTGGDVNPNYSKLLVSTEDQIDKPIFSFRKSNIPDSSTPSFYWGSTGQNSPLKLKSGYEFSINLSSQPIGSLAFRAKGLGAGQGATGNVLMYGRNFNNTGRILFLSGPQRFTATRHFILQSPPLSITPTRMTLPGYFINWGYFSCTPSASLSQPEGFYLSRGQTASNVDILRFFYGPTSGLVSNLSTYLRVTQYQIFDGVDSSGNPIEKVGSSFIVGSTGDSTFLSWASSNQIDGPTGPFAYHIKSANTFPSRTGTQIPFSAGRWYLDASDITMYNKDVVVVRCTGAFSGGNNVYIKIPSAPVSIPNPNYYPLWGTTYCSEYRIILDYGGSANRNRNIVGITWDQVVRGGGFNVNSTTYLVQTILLGSPGCKFIDIMYKYNTGDSQVYAYIKTCNGKSVAIKMTDYSSAEEPLADLERA